MDGYSIRHIGLDMDFYHPESESLKLTRGIEDSYSIDKEKAVIFIETASDSGYSPEDLLQWYFAGSKKALAEHLPARPAAAAGSSSRLAIVFPIQFPPETFHIMTDRGRVDIKTLRLAVEVSVVNG